MAEHPSPHPARPDAAAIDPERDAKIDELLLAGLEHYFAGRYQESINVWERVLFIDRGHARARAYIERARGAQAERQRRSEELAQEGVAALHRGDGDTARELLESAAVHGERPDVALAYLERLERLAGGTLPHGDAPKAPKRKPLAAPRVLTAATASRRADNQPVRAWPLIVLAVVAGGAIIVAASFDLLKPLLSGSWGKSGASPAVTLASEPLPIPRPADLAITHARALANTGHLRDALAALDQIPAGDPSLPEAERLRADVQHRLLEAVSLLPPSAEPSRDIRE